MATQTQSPASTIKNLLKEEGERRQSLILEGYKNFVANCRGTSSAGVLWMLLGEENHMAVDVIREMKETARYLLGFLAEPKNAQNFAEFRECNAHDYAKHLVQWISALEWADDPLTRAETGLYELQIGSCTNQQLDGLEYDLEHFQKTSV